MAAVSFVAPILPGKLEAWHRFNQETLGQWGAEHDAANRRHGITRELAWHQQTPDGDLAIVFMEVEDPAALFQDLAASNTPYQTWFRKQVFDIHGLDLTAADDGAMSRLEFDWQAQ